MPTVKFKPLKSTSPAVSSPAPSLATPSSSQAKPFVKWAGGKTQLLPELLPRLPKQFDNYFEPFLGGGALFFSIAHTLRYSAVVSDADADLISTYQIVRNRPKQLMGYLEKEKNTEEYFYYRRAKGSPHRVNAMGEVNKASRFIYLNRTCFRGLHRKNARGEFNVPYGNYKKPVICDRENLTAVSRVLNDGRVSIEHSGYKRALKPASNGDFVFLDPPYAPLTPASFTKYTGQVFQQDGLLGVCKELNKNGVKFMMTQSDCAYNERRYADFLVEKVAASRRINSKAPGSKTTELIIRNYS